MVNEQYQHLMNISKIFLDQNINRNVKIELERKGYKNVSTVYTLGYNGANDGKLLRLIKDNHMILVTYDYKFHKMAMKYNNEMTILLIANISSGRYNPKTIANHINDAMQKIMIKIFRYYAEVHDV